MNDPKSTHPAGAFRSRWLDALVSLAVRRPAVVLAGWAVITALSLVGVTRLEVDTTTESVLDRSAEAWGFYEESVREYGSDESIVLALEAAEPFAPETLRDLSRLTKELEEIRGVRRVDSLATVPIVRPGDEGSVALDPVLPSEGPLDPTAIASQLRGDRISPRTLVSEDGRVFGVNVLLESELPGRYDDLVEEVGEVARSYGIPASGVPIFRRAVNESTRSEVLRFVPVTVLLVGVLLALAFGSFPAVVIPLVTSGLAVLATLGVMGFLGVPMSISTMVLPSILLALGCAYGMHVLTAAQGLTGPAELTAAACDVSGPVALSGLTTAIGFMGVAVVRIDVIRELGTFGSLGVLIVLAATLTFAPAALRLFPIRRAPGALDALLRGPLLRRLLPVAGRYGGATIGLWLLASVLFGAGVARMEVDTDIIRWFHPEAPIRQAYREIRARLSGISPMNVVVSSTKDESIATPAVLLGVERLALHLEQLDDVGRAISLADPMRQLHRSFAEMDGLPESAALTDQYLLILESVDYLHDLIAEDHTSTTVLLRVDNNGSTHLLEVAREADRWWAEHGPPGTTARTTGIMYEFARAEDEITHGQIRGLLLALLVIGALLALIFRRPRTVIVALLPNALPLTIIFGWMGLVGIPLDAATVSLGALALGIAVDDTIHVATRYRAGRARGQDPLQSLEAAFHRVLPPLVYSTAAVGLGFAVLAISEFTVTRNLGIVTAAVMVLCWAADTTLLPALLLRSERNRDASTPEIITKVG